MKARWRTGAGIAAVAMAACSPIVAPETAPDPCALLSTECSHCADPGPKQTCQTAVASGDPVQCTVALDDSNVMADCVVPDGGGDATLETSSDAPPLAACDAAQVSPDAGCACVPPCTTTCASGGCEIACPAGATCKASCAGGNCVFQCATGATCTDSCEGGGCTFQCSTGAVCNDTCATTPPCVGP